MTYKQGLATPKRRKSGGKAAKKTSRPANPEQNNARPAGRTWRSRMVLETAKDAGYFGGSKSERVGGRIARRLILEAKTKSGIESQTELLEYALSKVALEDDFGPKLLARKGSISEDVDF